MANLKKDMAYRVSDPNFDDFEQSVYDECILVAQRKVAKRYNLIQRMYPLTAVACEENCDDLTGPQATEDIVLPMTNFVSEYEVLINEKRYFKVDRITNQSVDEYVLERNENSILFNYWPRTQKDSVKIYFTSDINGEDFDIEELEPIIPSQYEEELRGLALVELAKFGIVKFGGSQKENKYKNILSIYGIDERSLERDLMKNNAWATVEVYRVY